jgi:hypothetical protein
MPDVLVWIAKTCGRHYTNAPTVALRLRYSLTKLGLSAKIVAKWFTLRKYLHVLSGVLQPASAWAKKDGSNSGTQLKGGRHSRRIAINYPALLAPAGPHLTPTLCTTIRS